MKAFVTGICGQLGHDVVEELLRRNYSVIGTDLIEYPIITSKIGYSYICMDITDQEAVDRVICSEKPDAIIHCAAWTAVDVAEMPENHDKVKKINVDGTRYLAEAAKAVDAK